ncbi:hypothetical protein Tco_0978982 [Tanacetum coccineum]|uniref:Uncharacterized protein n=1 Tax=Tanacetum coccineum TaxID=301880 RepID=A0ABQ5EPG4_9ASTR
MVNDDVCTLKKMGHSKTAPIQLSIDSTIQETYNMKDKLTQEFQSTDYIFTTQTRSGVLHSVELVVLTRDGGSGIMHVGAGEDLYRYPHPEYGLHSRERIMEQENLQQAALDEALVPIVDQVKIGSCNMRIEPLKTQKEPTYQPYLEYSLKQYRTTILSSLLELFREILRITPRVPNQEFVEPPPHDAIVSFVKQLSYKGALELVSEIYTDHMYQPWRTFLPIINRLTADRPVLRDKNISEVCNKERTTPELWNCPVRDSMMNDEIRSSGKGLMGKKKPDTGVQQGEKKKATTPRKKSSIIADDNIIPDPDEALKLDTTESEETEDDEVQPFIQRSSTSGSDDDIEDVSSDDEIKVDENKADAEVTKEQAGIELAKEESPVNDQDGIKQAEGELAKVQVPDLAVPNPSSSLTLSSSEYGNQFINENLDVSINDILKDITEIQIQSMVYVPIHQEDLVVQRTPLVDTVISMVTENSTPTPTPPPTEAQVTTVSEPDPSLIVLQRLLELEKKVEVLSKVDHAEAIEESVQAKPSKTDKTVDADETIQEAAMDTEEPVQDNVVNAKEQPQDDAAPKQDNSIWFKQDVVLVNAEKDPLTFDDLIGSTIDFTKFAKNRLKKDKITKSDLEDQLDWANPEGDKCPYDMSKPLPLKGPPGHLTILVDFFFNNDLEYLKTGNKERKYAASLTKIKAAMYELKATSRHEVYSRMKILSVIRITVAKQFEYGYLSEIVVRRAYQKEYTFKEANFSRLHSNYIEDMFLLYVQNKFYNLTGDEIVDLVTALRTFTRGIVIQRRVEDVQLGVESYQKNLNITRPQTTCDGISDGTLKSVHDNLNEMLQNFVLGYNHGIPKRAWTEKDQK